MKLRKKSEISLWQNEKLAACSLILSFLVLAIFTACSQLSSQWPHAGGAAPDPFKTLNIEPVSANSVQFNYARVHESVLAPYCIRCHGSAGGIALDNIESIRSHSEKIIENIIPPDRKMPLGPNAMTDEDRALLYYWLKAGAPLGSEPTPTPAPTVTPQPTPVAGPNFDYIYNGIFTTYQCLTCHTPGGDGGGYLLTKDGLLMANGNVTPGDPDDSVLLSVLTGDPNYPQMPPPKTHLPKVPASDVDLIHQWIQNGAP